MAHRRPQHPQIFTLSLCLLLMNSTPSQSLSTPSPSTCLWTPHGSPYPLTALASGTCPDPSSPWSQPPSCPSPPNKHIGGDDPDDCVFTHTTFRNAQGISLITVPSVAAALAEALDDTIVPDYFRNLSSPQAPASDKGYAIRNIPGKGKGVVLTKPVRQHETILMEHPVLLVRFDFMRSERFGAELRREMLERALEALPEETRRGIEQLARGGGGMGRKMEAEGWVADVVRTNGYGGVEVEGVGHMGLFLEGARVNHGCRPK